LFEWVLRGSDLIVDLQGELDLTCADRAAQAIDSLIDANRGARRVILRMDRVSFIDSSGIGMVFGRQRRLLARGAVLAIAGPSARVTRTLDLLGVSKLMPVYVSLESALSAREEVRKWNPK
jgi:stage II sporulation protein AA (anti-sigma F factor antagonist)